MIKGNQTYYSAILLIIPIIFLNCVTSNGQVPVSRPFTYEDYAGEFIDELDPYLASLEEWQEMIDHWLEKPLCINNEEADLLAEYKIISLYQLNKLKEYRLKYGDLLTLHELEFIEDWDHLTCRKVSPLTTVENTLNKRTSGQFNYHAFRQSLVVKSSFSTSKGKGYKNLEEEDESTSKYYRGSPYRFAMRYDLGFKDKVLAGIRLEKDPGEPFLVGDSSASRMFRTPDMTAGYLQINNIGPVDCIIIGNYRVSFGYGLNISGGMSGMKSRNGMAGMDSRLRPQSSVSEYGFWRGAAISSDIGKLSIACFASRRNLDGTSLKTDTLTGNVISFSSIDQSGLHRSDNELIKRKSISETMLGSYIVFRNQWLKTGMIAMYNRFTALVSDDKSTYDKFGLQGQENLIGGFSATAWLPKIQFMTEVSVSRNKSSAILAGLQMTPVPGALISLVYRHFGVAYQNWNGSGFATASRNSAENGIQVNIRLELPARYLIEIKADQSRNRWTTFDLNAPSIRQEFSILADKAWTPSHSLNLSLRYIRAAIEDQMLSDRICHPLYRSQYKIRLEHRVEATAEISFKSRIECSTGDRLPVGWLILQDIGVAVERLRAKLWMRICFFDVMSFENSIYAYENDVQYDFTSFMHYGKGLRGVLMARQSLMKWLDIWLRYSTVYYSNKNIGTGWDETGSNRQHEFEIQIRMKWPD